MKKTILACLLLVAMLTTLTSCLTTKTNVGAYRESNGDTYVHAKGKQIWLFWGLLPLGRTSVSTPTSGSCQVITKFSLLDVIISGVTGGLVITETIKVKGKK